MLILDLTTKKEKLNVISVGVCDTQKVSGEVFLL